MSIRNIVFICISVGLLGGSAYMIYNNFIEPSFDASLAPSQSVSPITLSIKKIFPYGDSLDFSAVRSFNSDGKIFNYPKAGDGDVGVSGKDLFNTTTGGQ